jgi:hypothetical protein
MPPLHWNCVLPDTNVSPIGLISYITKRPFDGQVITFRTSRNKVFTVTPNHPVMTDRGFVYAKFIKQGDNVVSSLIADTAIPARDNYEMKSSIEDTFDSILTSGKMIACPMPHSTEDFHGDVSEHEVGIILINVELLDSNIPSIAHQFVKNFLKIGGIDSPINESGLSHFSDFVVSLFSSCGGLVGVSSKSLDLIRSRIIHSGLLLLRAISGFNPVGFETFPNDGWSDIHNLSDTSNTYAFIEKTYNGAMVNGKMPVFMGSIPVVGFKDSEHGASADTCFDNDFVGLQSGIKEMETISDISFSSFSGHVYNLGCESGCFSANGIITHNCRSTTIPVVKPEYSLAAGLKGERPSIGADGVETVGSKTTYGGWLKKQPAAFVDEALGPERSKLFRSGAIKIGGFTDPTGRVYTLKELRGMNPIAFQE